MYKQRIRRWIAKCTIVTAGAFVAACTETVTPDPPALTTISVTTSAPTVVVGQSVTATATGADQNGSAIPTGTVTWTSSAGVSIDATGKVTGVSAGPATITATATASGVTGQATLTVSALPASALKVVTPPSPSSPSRARFAQQPVIQLVNSAGGDVSQSGVTVTVSSTGGGALTGNTATTDASGKATFTDLSLGGLAANYTLTFSASSLSSQTAVVALTAGAAVQVQMLAGDQQQAQAGSAVTIPPSVRVLDADGNPVPGASVLFDVATGGGSVAGSPAVSNTSGIAAPTTWTLGSSGANSLLAHLAANPFGVTFTATATLPPPVLTSLVVTLNPSTVAAGSQTQASASGVDQYGAAIATGTVVWSTSGPATVSPAGLVSAVAAGQAVVIATAGGKTAQATLTITAQPVLTTLTVTVASSTITVGGTTQATASGKDQFGAPIAVGAVTWTALGNASVNSNGLVTGTNAGAAAVRATAGGLSAQADLVVQGAAPATPVLTTLFVQLMPSTTPVGGSSQASVTGADQFGFPIATGPITWSATGGATISASGAISATSVGSATITATAGGISGNALLTVTSAAQPPVLTSLTVSVAPASIAVGGSAQATAVGKDQFGATIATGSIVWSGTGSISVNQSGVITGNSAGAGTVTASAGSVSGSAPVIVTGAGSGALAAIDITINPSTVPVGSPAQAVATGRDQAGNPVALGVVTWTSDAGITINASGAISGTTAVGAYTVYAVSGGKQASATLNVSGAPRVSQLTLTLTPSTVGIGGQSQGSVTARDQYGNSIAPGPIAWYAGLGASVTQQGLVVGTAAGQTTISVQNTVTSVAAAATLTVTGSAPNLRLSANSPPANIPNRNTFSTQPSIQLVDVNTGQPVAQAGVVVTASLTRGLGTLLGTTSISTNSSGRAVWTDLGVVAERVNGAIITFSAPGVQAVDWTFNIIGGSVPSAIVKRAGDNQTNVTGWLVRDDLEIAVVDPEGNPVSVVVPVNFTVTAGGGSISGASTVTANGLASVNLWRLGAVGTNSVTVTVPGVSTPAVFNATATPTLPCAAPGTLTIGQQTFGKLQHTGCVFHFGGSFTGPTIDSYVDYDAYVIDVPAGAAVRFDVGYDFGTFRWPSLSLYDPAGTFIGSRRADSATPLSLVNPTASTVRYTLLISYSTGQYTGGFYNITPVRTN